MSEKTYRLLQQYARELNLRYQWKLLKREYWRYREAKHNHLAAKARYKYEELS